MPTKRIINLQPQTTLDDSVMMIMDSSSGGSVRYPIGSLINSLAPTFDPDEDYLEGNFVLKDGKLYKFNENHDAGAWTGEDVDEVIMSNMLGGGGGGTGLTNTIKQALLQIAEKIVYIDANGQDYYDDLYDALYPPIPASAISAVYTQSGPVYANESLNSLKADLVVTATYPTGDEVLDASQYTLSGTLEAGTSTITVGFQELTTTFTVTVLPAAYSFISPCTSWSHGSDISTANATTDSIEITKSGSGGSSWNFSVPLYQKTDALSGKHILMECDIEITGNSLQDAFSLGAFSTTSTNPTYGGIRSGYYEQKTSTSGHFKVEFDIADSNLVVASNQYIGMQIYFSATQNAVVKVSNIKGIYY